MCVSRARFTHSVMVDVIQLSCPHVCCACRVNESPVTRGEISTVDGSVKNERTKILDKCVQYSAMYTRISDATNEKHTTWNTKLGRDGNAHTRRYRRAHEHECANVCETAICVHSTAYRIRYIYGRARRMNKLGKSRSLFNCVPCQI